MSHQSQQWHKVFIQNFLKDLVNRIRQQLMDHNKPKCKWKHLCLFNRLCWFQSRQDWAIEVPAAYGFLLNLIAC